MINQEIAGHTGHPSGEGALRKAVTGQGAVYAQKDLLRKILGFRAIAREPVTDIVNSARMAAHKLLPGRAIALEALLDQLGVLLQRFISLKSCGMTRRDSE
jgi:hypothetical protein